MELQQDEPQLANLAKVIGWIREYCDLEPPQHQDDPVTGLKC